MAHSYIYKKIFIAIVLGAVAISAGSCYLLPDEEEVLPAPTVKATEIKYTTVKAKRKDIEKKIVASGTVTSENKYNVSYEKEGGTISEFYIHTGDNVKKGDKICLLETTEIEYQIKLKELDRKRALLNTYVLLEKDCTQAEYDRAYVDVELLDIELEKLYKQRDGALLTSPASGTVCAMADIRVGDYASPGQTVATIMKTENLYIPVKPTDLTAFSMGQEVQIRIDDEYYTGEVFMNPEELSEYKKTKKEKHEKSEEGEIEFENDTIYVRFKDEAPTNTVGQLADIILVQERSENAIVVSNNLIKDLDGEMVIYVLKDGEKTAVPVELGMKTGSQTEVISGISEGDELIIR